MMTPLAFISFTFAIAAVSSQESTVTAQIGSVASVVGYRYSNPDGFAFYGIPYAQPPIGQLRFAPTQRKNPAGRMLAFHFGSECVQKQDGGNQDEDCLYLNIWTPKMTNFTANKYPVLLYIHGGGFIWGNGNLYSEGVLSNLVSRGIIVVSINYRLGPFGFFSTRDSVVPGNQGIIDQIEGLNWVIRYISYFGGDPNAITIDGESAGAQSVSLLTLTPLTKGLYQRAIVESGSAFSPGVFSYSDTQTDISKWTAVNFSCITAAQWERHDPTLMAQMLQCMRSKSVAVVQTVTGVKWGAVLDNYVLPDVLEKLMLNRAPIPVIIGNCNNESATSYMGKLESDPKFLSKFNRQYITQHITNSALFKYYNQSANIIHEAIRVLVDSMPFTDQDHVNWMLQSCQFDGDLLFVGPTYREAMNFRQTNSPVYLYSFDYLAPGVHPTLNHTFRGVPHTWELQYLFGYPGAQEGGWTLTPDDTATVNYFGTYWANFVKYGNPTPSPSAVVWPQLGTSGEYMSLGPMPTPKANFHPSAATFWACTVPTIEGYKPAWCL